MHFVLLGQILHLYTRRRRQCIHPQSWYWPMVLVNWLLLAGGVALVQWAECLKKFQVRFDVLHRFRLNPWACASWHLANHSGSSLPPWFSSPSVSVDFVPVDFLFSVATLNGQSRDSVVPRLLTPHLHLEWPEVGSAALQEEVQQVGAAGQHVEVHVEVLAAIWTFVVFWSDFVAQLTAIVWLMVIHNCGIFIRYSNRLLENHGLNFWYLWRLWRLRVRMFSITRSGPLPLSPILWWLIIIAITHWNWIKLRLSWWRSRT